jgi:hypothetical protein
VLQVFLYIFLTLNLSLYSHAKENASHNRPEVGDISEVPFRSYSDQLKEDEKPQYFISHLGCKKSDGEEEAWDTDKYIWEIGKDLQNKSYTLDNFIKGIDRIFDKAYKFKSDFTEVVFWNKDKKPINSDDLNIYKKEREEFKKILKEILQPFEDEGSKNHISPIAPDAYRKSFALYKQRIEKLNKWKDIYPNKIRILCPANPDLPKNAFSTYEKDSLSSNFKDNNHPPLDVLAHHVVNSIGCDEKDWKTPPLSLWYIGDRLQSGEFSFEEWSEAFKKELDEAVKAKLFDKEARTGYEKRFNDLLVNFSSNKQDNVLPLTKGIAFESTLPVIKNYKDIRSQDIKLQQWIIEQKILKKQKFPCDPDKVIQGRGMIDQIHYAIDPPEKNTNKNFPLQSCLAVRNNLEKKYSDQFAELKQQLETVFYGAEINFAPEHNPDAIRKEKEEINEIVTKATMALKGKELSKSFNLAQDFSLKHATKLSSIIEPRLSGIVLQNHIDDLVSFWTKNFILNNTSPNSNEGQKLISSFLATKNRESNTKMVLSCYESNGRAYFFASHGNEKNNTVYIPPNINDSQRVLQAIQEQKKKQKANPKAHHFDKQTNWGSAQISFDQSSISTPPGRYYHEVISDMVYAKDKKNTLAGSDQSLEKIINECKLKSLLSKSNNEEIKKIGVELQKRMRNSLSKTNLNSLSAIEDFAYIQQFCIPLHLNFANKIYLNSLRTGRKYFGSVGNESRAKECKSVGKIDDASNPVINDVNNYVLGILKANYQNTISNDKLAKFRPEEIKEMKEKYALLEQKEKEHTKYFESFDKLKDDADMTKYFKRLQDASLNDAWKLFTISKPLTGWLDNNNVETSENLRKALEKYSQSDESNFEKNKREFFEAQQERRKSSLQQLTDWINSQKNFLNGKFSQQIEQSFSHLKDRFQALNDFYDTYEKELADQIRLCRENQSAQSISVMLPIYKDPTHINESSKKPMIRPKKK